LPEVKKPVLGTKITAGIDPGVDKFIAEDVKPLIQKAKEVAKWISESRKTIMDTVVWNWAKPIIPAEKAVGREAPAIVIEGIHKPESLMPDWDTKELDNIETNIGGLEKWFNKNFSNKDMENLMLSRGEPDTADGLRIKQEALKNLPNELKGAEMQKAITEIADINYNYLTQVAGEDIGRIPDYFYGIYKDKEVVDEFLENWRTTEKFIKEKKFPTYADAKAYGLKLKSTNPIDNLRSEYTAIARLEGIRWMRDELARTGKGIYIDTQDKAPRGWVKIKDAPLFKGLKLEPNLGRMVNKLLSTNKVSEKKALSALRAVNNTLRTTKFVGSAFHLGVISKQAIADAKLLQLGIKPTSYRGLTKGFLDNDPIFKTEAYKDYLAQGGGHQYSIDVEAQKSFSTMVDKINRGNYLGGIARVPMIPITINKVFIDWLFTKYIPKVKYAKYLDNVAMQEKKLGRPLTRVEKQDIIREGQNFYGEMNERLFGRGGTATSVLRLVFMSPGFAEGNFTTIVKGATEWGQGGKSAARSRSNMINSLLLSAIISTIGTLILTRKAPKKPESFADFRDLFKIDTGKIDLKGRKIMLDTLTYDKDYYEVAAKALMLEPGDSIWYSIKRLGGMEATTFEFLKDMGSLISGEKLIDWKDDPVFYDTDDFGQKILKIAIYEMKRLEPISFGVYKSARNKEVSKVISALEALSGVRPTTTEGEKRKQKSLNQIYDLKGRQEELYYHLKTANKPREAIENYNKRVNQILDSSIMPKGFKEEWSPKLIIDVDRLLSNKIYTFTKDSIDADEKKDIKQFMNNFDVDLGEAERLLKVYREKHPLKNPFSSTNVNNRKKREANLRDRF